MRDLHWLIRPGLTISTDQQEKSHYCKQQDHPDHCTPPNYAIFRSEEALPQKIQLRTGLQN